MPVKNAITIDVENWFDRPILKNHLENIPLLGDHLSHSIDTILELLRKYRVMTTFFVLGKVAESDPEVVEKIARDGHEIGCHGFSHRKPEEVGRDAFQNEIKRATSAISHITGKEPLGFRAPMCSVTRKTYWSLEILKGCGYKYDSSVMPGLFDFTPWGPYVPSSIDPFSRDDRLNSDFLEFPVLTRRLIGLRVRAAGGFYMRLFGSEFIRKSIDRINKKGEPAICYFHPWELCGFPRINLPITKKIFAYYNVPCIKQFEDLLRSLEIAPAKEILGINA